MFGRCQRQQRIWGESSSVGGSGRTTDLQGPIEGLVVVSLCLERIARRPTRGESNEEHEDGSLWVTVANGGRDGGEPFLWVALLVIGMNSAFIDRIY
jgi:hypothetical protein